MSATHALTTHVGTARGGDEERSVAMVEVGFEQSHGELLAEFADGALAGEHALAPERLLFGEGVEPGDRDDPFGVVAVDFAASEAAAAGLGLPAKIASASAIAAITPASLVCAFWKNAGRACNS